MGGEQWGRLVVGAPALMVENGEGYDGCWLKLVAVGVGRKRWGENSGCGDWMEGSGLF